MSSQPDPTTPSRRAAALSAEPRPVLSRRYAIAIIVGIVSTVLNVFISDDD